MHYVSNLFDKSTLHVSDMSTVHHQEYLNTVYTQQLFVILGLLESVSVVGMEFQPDHVRRQTTELAWQILIACIQCWDTPDDGQWTCPKHVEYFIK